VASEDHSLIDRRSFLKTGTAGLAAAGLFSGTSSAYHDLADDYGSFLDVTEHGADPGGDDSVSGVIEDLADDDTLLKFPSGRYYMDRMVRFTDFEHFGMVGKSDATLVPADFHSFSDGTNKLFRLGNPDSPGNGLHLENFEVDMTADDTGARVFDVAVDDGLFVDDINVNGRHDSGSWGPALFRITDSGGEGVVRDFRAPDGGDSTDQAPANHLWRGPTGILCTWAHEGSIRFQNCKLGGFPDNGLYAAGGSGDVYVEGGRYTNSGTASIRVGGGGDIAVTGATVAVDRQPWDIPQEGIRINSGDWVMVDNVEINMPRPSGEGINVGNGVESACIKNLRMTLGEDPMVGIHVHGDAGPTYMKHVDIEINGSNNAIQIEGEDAGRVGLQDVNIDGDAGGGTMRHAIRCLRNECQFRDVTIDQPGGNKRRGIAILGEHTYVEGCDIAASERGFSVMNGPAWLQENRSVSYDDDRASIKIFDDVDRDDVRLKGNEFPNGIDA
jgi:hypothetical protein